MHKKMVSWLLIVSVMLSTFVFMPQSAWASVAVTGVTVAPTTATVNVGATQQLTATVAPADATNKDVTWSSSNNLVATVSAGGLVTGVAAGTATITVTTVDGAHTATSTITVTVPVAVTGVTVAPTTATVNVGATQQLTATVAPADATNKDVTWSSSNNLVATVSAGGLVTGVAAGTATITVTTVDGAHTATSTITVTVPAPAPAPAPTPTPAPAPTPPTVVEQPIVAGQTTEVELDGVVTVTVTAGAITGAAPRITAQVMPGAAAVPLMAAAAGVGIIAASEIVVLTMTGGEFTAPVQLTLNFDTAKVAAGQVPSVFVYNERTGRWIFIGGQVGVGTITVTVDRFSKFAVFATRFLPALADIADHWGRGSIRTLAGMGIVSGFPDGRFNPNAGVTRAEFVSMLTRALGLSAKPEAAARFTDAIGWAQGAIGAATEAGLLAGYPDGTFGGSRLITRAEMAVILQRVIRKGLVPVPVVAEVDFADAVDFPTWTVDGIRTASRAGLISGFPDRTFRPGSTTTRAEAAAMLYRLIAKR